MLPLVAFFLPLIIFSEEETYYSKRCITKGLDTLKYDFFPSHFQGCSQDEPNITLYSNKNETCYREVCVCHEEGCNHGMIVGIDGWMCTISIFILLMKTITL